MFRKILKKETKPTKKEISPPTNFTHIKHTSANSPRTERRVAVEEDDSYLRPSSQIPSASPAPTPRKHRESGVDLPDSSWKPPVPVKTQWNRDDGQGNSHWHVNLETPILVGESKTPQDPNNARARNMNLDTDSIYTNCPEAMCGLYSNLHDINNSVPPSMICRPPTPPPKRRQQGESTVPAPQVNLRRPKEAEPEREHSTQAVQMGIKAPERLRPPSMNIGLDRPGMLAGMTALALDDPVPLNTTPKSYTPFEKPGNLNYSPSTAPPAPAGPIVPDFDAPVLQPGRPSPPPQRKPRLFVKKSEQVGISREPSQKSIRQLQHEDSIRTEFNAHGQEIQQIAAELNENLEERTEVRFRGQNAALGEEEDKVVHDLEQYLENEGGTPVASPIFHHQDAAPCSVYVDEDDDLYGVAGGNTKRGQTSTAENVPDALIEKVFERVPIMSVYNVEIKKSSGEFPAGQLPEDDTLQESGTSCGRAEAVPDPSSTDVGEDNLGSSGTEHIRTSSDESSTSHREPSADISARPFAAHMAYFSNLDKRDTTKKFPAPAVPKPPRALLNIQETFDQPAAEVNALVAAPMPHTPPRNAPKPPERPKPPSKKDCERVVKPLSKLPVPPLNYTAEYPQDPAASGAGLSAVPGTSPEPVRPPRGQARTQQDPYPEEMMMATGDETYKMPTPPPRPLPPMSSNGFGPPAGPKPASWPNKQVAIPETPPPNQTPVAPARKRYLHKQESTTSVGVMQSLQSLETTDESYPNLETSGSSSEEDFSEEAHYEVPTRAQIAPPIVTIPPPLGFSRAKETDIDGDLMTRTASNSSTPLKEPFIVAVEPAVGGLASEESSDAESNGYDVPRNIPAPMPIAPLPRKSILTEDNTSICSNSSWEMVDATPANASVTPNFSDTDRRETVEQQESAGRKRLSALLPPSVSPRLPLKIEVHSTSKNRCSEADIAAVSGAAAASSNPVTAVPKSVARSPTQQTRQQNEQDSTLPPKSPTPKPRWRANIPSPSSSYRTSTAIGDAPGSQEASRAVSRSAPHRASRTVAPVHTELISSTGASVQYPLTIESVALSTPPVSLKQSRDMEKSRTSPIADSAPRAVPQTAPRSVPVPAPRVSRQSSMMTPLDEPPAELRIDEDEQVPTSTTPSPKALSNDRKRPSVEMPPVELDPCKLQVDPANSKLRMACAPVEPQPQSTRKLVYRF